MCCGSVNKQYIKHFNGLKFTAFALSAMRFICECLHSLAVFLVCERLCVCIGCARICAFSYFVYNLVFRCSIKPLRLSSDSLYIIIILLNNSAEDTCRVLFSLCRLAYATMFVLIKRFDVKFNRVHVVYPVSVRHFVHNISPDLAYFHMPYQFNCLFGN